MKIQESISILKDFGFTEYEAKIYITLLSKHPLNGNEIASISGVPSPKVYECLRRLTEKEYIFPVTVSSQQKKMKKYIPLPFSELLNNFQRDFRENKNTLNSFFEEISTRGNYNESELLHIQGYATSLEAIKQSIDESQQVIYLSCWKEELNYLLESLTAAHLRGVKIIMIFFNDTPMDTPWKSYYHFSSYKRHEGELSCVIDEKKVFVLESLKEDPHTIVATHKSLVKTTCNYIRHDIYVNRILADFIDILSDHYGENLEKLISEL